MSNREIDLNDIPEVSAEQMERATLRVGGKPVALTETHADNTYHSICTSVTPAGPFIVTTR